MQEAIADFNPVAAKRGKFTLAVGGGNRKPEQRQQVIGEGLEWHKEGDIDGWVANWKWVRKRREKKE